MDFIDYYKELGVKRDAAPEEIQRAYRKIARKYHPDVNKEAGAEDRFKRAAEAYEVLKDADKRKKYDVLGSAYKNGGASGPPPPGGQRPPQGYEDIFNFMNQQRARGQQAPTSLPRTLCRAAGLSGFSDFFEAIFGRGGSSPSGNPFQAGEFGEELPSDGADVEAILALSLEEAAAGGDREISSAIPTLASPRTSKSISPRASTAARRSACAAWGDEGCAAAPGAIPTAPDQAPSSLSAGGRRHPHLALGGALDGGARRRGHAQDPGRSGLGQGPGGLLHGAHDSSAREGLSEGRCPRRFVCRGQDCPAQDPVGQGARAL